MLTKNQYFDLSNIDRDNKLFAINNYIWIDLIKSFMKQKKKENEKPKFILNVLFILYTLIGPN